MADEPKSQGWWHTLPGVLTAVAAMLTAVSGLILALREAGFFAHAPQAAAPAPAPAPVRAREPVPAPPSARTAPAASATAAPGAAVSGQFEFAWPGMDCWEILRAGQRVADGCGAARQALQAGGYTVRSKHNQAFAPFDIVVDAGQTTRAEIGGVLQFDWPGNDCWEIRRGEQRVASHCGRARQALQAGDYTVRARQGAVFEPFDVRIADGATVRMP